MALGAIIFPYNKIFCLDVVTWKKHPYKNKENKSKSTSTELPPFLASIS
jgi:hypothetical protein